MSVALGFLMFKPLAMKVSPSTAVIITDMSARYSNFPIQYKILSR